MKPDSINRSDASAGSADSNESAGREEFCEPGRLVDGDLELRLAETRPAFPDKGLVPSYVFHMVRTGTAQRMGSVSLRIGNTPRVLLYAGHIGYGVSRPFRGHRYAARSVGLLLPLAARHGLDPLWITCSPDNIASRRSIELAGGQFVETVDIPPGHDMYQKGERQKCRYRFDLGRISTR